MKLQKEESRKKPQANKTDKEKTGDGAILKTTVGKRW